MKSNLLASLAAAFYAASSLAAPNPDLLQVEISVDGKNPNIHKTSAAPETPEALLIFVGPNANIGDWYRLEIECDGKPVKLNPDMPIEEVTLYGFANATITASGGSEFDLVNFGVGSVSKFIIPPEELATASCTTPKIPSSNKQLEL